jgi:hypothetical protein
MLPGWALLEPVDELVACWGLAGGSLAWKRKDVLVWSGSCSQIV